MMAGCGDILKEWAPSNKEAMMSTSNIFAVFWSPEKSVFKCFRLILWIDYEKTTGVLLTPDIDNDSTQVSFGGHSIGVLEISLQIVFRIYFYDDNIKLKAMTLAVHSTVEILINLKIWHPCLIFVWGLSNLKHFVNNLNLEMPLQWRIYGELSFRQKLCQIMGWRPPLGIHGSVTTLDYSFLSQ